MNPQTARAVRLLLFVLLCATGCSGIGRAVVGKKQGGASGAPLCEQPTPLCDEAPPPTSTPDAVPPSAATIDLAECAPTPPPVVCGSAPIHADDPPDCASPLELGSESDAQAALAVQQCSNLSIVDERTEPDTRVVRVESAQLTSVNVTLESALPLTVELAQASLQHVWFELRGPVTLQITASRSFADVRVSATGGGEAALELDDVTGLALSVGTEATRFHGDVSVRRSTLERAQISADAIELESVWLRDAALSTDRLDAADTTADRIAVDAKRSLLSSCTVSAASFSDCSAFTAIQGTYMDTAIDACIEDTRIYGSQFRSGTLEGTIVLDRAALRQVRLGMKASVAIAGWDVDLQYARFCSDQNTSTFGGTSMVSCIYPRPESTCDVDVCTVAQAMFFADAPDCDPFEHADVCAAPEPQRMRPPFE